MIEAYEAEKRDIYESYAFLDKKSTFDKLFYTDKGFAEMVAIEEWMAREKEFDRKFYGALLQPDPSRVEQSYREEDLKALEAGTPT